MPTNTPQNFESARPETSNNKPAARLSRAYKVPVLGPVVYFLFPPRKSNSRWRKAFSGLTASVALLGVGMAAYPYAGTFYPFFFKAPVEKLIEWSNFLSDLKSNGLQDNLKDRFGGALASGDTLLGEGDPLTRMIIKKIGVDTIVVEGTSSSALRAGSGHYARTPLPGAIGNVAIAGHRTTYGRPFAKLDKLAVGDEVILETPKGRHIYKLTRKPWITTPNDWTVIEVPTNDALLTLTTCHPKGSAKQRLIVRAQLVRTEPVGGVA